MPENGGGKENSCHAFFEVFIETTRLVNRKIRQILYFVMTTIMTDARIIYVFSEYRSCPDGPEWSDEELVVEPVLGATLKFGMFLSNRPYTTD